MTKFPSEEELLAYCKSLDIKANFVRRVSPPDYKYKFYWNLPRGATDDLILKTYYKTTLASDNNVFRLIKIADNHGKYTISYHYFGSGDVLDGKIVYWDEDELKEVSFKDLPEKNDNELWMSFLKIIANGINMDTNYYNIDLLRVTNRLRLVVSEQRFVTGGHVITYDNFDHELRNELLSSLRSYFTYLENIKKQRSIKLTIVLADPDAPSGKKAIEFIDNSAHPEEIDLTVSFDEYCYDLMKNNLERFNKSYLDLVDRINTDMEGLATYILSDSEFTKCSNQKLRLAYVEDLLEKDDFKKYKPCFQLTDLNDRLEQRRFIDNLYALLMSNG